MDPIFRINFIHTYYIYIYKVIVAFASTQIPKKKQNKTKITNLSLYSNKHENLNKKKRNGMKTGAAAKR